MPTDPAAVVDRYLAVVADLDAEPESLAALLDPAARFVEYPNLVAPSGRKRDGAAAGAASRPPARRASTAAGCSPDTASTSASTSWRAGAGWTARPGAARSRSTAASGPAGPS